MAIDTSKDIVSDVDGVQVSFRPVTLPNQRVVHGNIFPLVLQIVSNSNHPITLESSATALRDLSERGITTDLLNKHACVIFRGCPDSSAKAFSTLVHASEEGRGHEPYDQIGLAGSRTVHDKEVFSASEAPPNLWIHQHNEYSRYTKFPSNIHFFCHVPAQQGGESPFAHSAELYDRINAEMPEFVKEIAERGINSPDIYRAPGKEAKNFIFTWAGPLAFGRDIDPVNDDMATKKAKAEIQVRRLTPHSWWREDDQLEVHQHVPAVRRHPATGKPVWFNSMCGRYGTAYDRGATDPPYLGDDGMLFLPASYTDGEAIPKKYLHRCWELSKEILVPVKTEAGDLALVDNYQCSHGRAPWFTGERKILVSMWDTTKSEEKILDY